MKQIFRSSLSSLIYRGSQILGRHEAGVRILSYHRVNDEVKGYLSVSKQAFEEQVAWLAADGWQGAGLTDLFEGRLGPKSVVFTFDDGYRDNYAVAYPVLKQFGFRATVFCIADELGLDPFLGEREIAEMRKDGFEFGSHTFTHPHLKQLSRNEKWREIAGSKKALEKRFNTSVDFFCYPYGEFDHEAVQIVEEAGYRGACSNIPGDNKSFDPFLLKRTEVSGFDSLEDFKKKMAGAFDLMHKFLHKVRGKA